jgi:hypothetical protein
MTVSIATPKVRQPLEGQTPLLGLTQQWQMLSASKRLSTKPPVLGSKDLCCVRDLSGQLVEIRKAMMTTRFLATSLHPSEILRPQNNAWSNPAP